jgi:proline iminopeptidase
MIIALSWILCSCSQSVRSSEEARLWPHIDPYETGHLRVSDIHEIYFELCGNPEGKPVFVLHGGPGASITPYYRRFFNPEKFHVVLFDQRGCGRSRPFAELRENTTQHLVEDIEKLRVHVGCEKIILFGGSWGTTLALAYAEAYPDNVDGIVLRGVFTATEEELDHYYYGGVRKFFPEVYDKLVATLPEPDKGLSPNVLFDLISQDDWDQRKTYSVAWVEYEANISKVEAIKADIEGLWAKSDTLRNLLFDLGLLENYYMSNGCFLEEGQLLNNTDKIRDIPAVIVNGRYDVICPPVTAYRLHQRLPKSKLVIAEMAGHAMNEKPIERALLEAMRQFE